MLLQGVEAVRVFDERYIDACAHLARQIIATFFFSKRLEKGSHVKPEEAVVI